MVVFLENQSKIFRPSYLFGRSVFKKNYMQSWILDYDFYKSASYLDNHRLQANFYENIQGLASLLGCNDKLVNPKRSVANHPNIKRWIRFEREYIHYIWIHLLWEWMHEKGYNSHINYKNYCILLSEVENRYGKYSENIPEWITDDLIKEHQQKLLLRNSNHYSKYFK